MTLLQALRQVPDHRHRQGQMYDLPHMLLFAILATTCGAIGYSDITLFISKKFLPLKQLFDLSWKNPPTHSTVHKILSEVRPEDLENAFRLFSKHLQKLKREGSKGEIPCLAIDGKVLRGSYDSNNQINNRSQGLISVMDTEELIILAHLDLDGKGEKGGEMSKVQELLEDLNQDCEFKGLLVSTDALHTQKKL
jgi:hypothetical protein